MLAMRSPNRIVRIPGKTRGSAATPPFPLPSLRLYGLGGGTSEPRDRCSPALRLTLGFVVADDLGAPFRFVVRASSQTQPCQCQFFKFPLALGIAHAFRGHGARMSDIRHEAKRPFMSFLFVRLGHPRHRVAPFEDAGAAARKNPPTGNGRGGPRDSERCADHLDLRGRSAQGRCCRKSRRHSTNSQQ